MERKIRTSLVYNLLYHIFLVIVPLVTTPYVSRKLGAMGIGDYAYAYSVANYFSLFIKLGLDNYGVRTIAYARDDKEKMSKEFWGIYFFQLLLAIVIVVVYLFYSFFFSAQYKLSIILVIFVLSSGIDITWFYWGMEEFKNSVMRSMVIKALATIAIFIFVRGENDTALYTLILSASYFLSQALLWPRVFKYVFFVKPTCKDVIKHIKPNLILFLPAIAVSFYKIMDKIMLGILSTKTELGFYESSEKIIKVPNSFIDTLGGVMQPRMSNLVSNNANRKYMHEVLKKSIIAMMLVSTIIGFGIMAVSDEFVPLFYGSGFEKCALLFQILLPSCVFLSFTNVMKTQYLLPKKLDKEYIVALFTGAAINMTVNLILIPRFESIGAAVGTLAAEMAVATVIGFYVKKGARVLDYYNAAVPFVISGVAMYLLGKVFRIDGINVYVGLLLKAFICFAFYVIVLLTQMISIKRFFPNSELYKETLSVIDVLRLKRDK